MFSVTKELLPLVMERGKEIASKVKVDELPISLMEDDIARTILRNTGMSFVSALTNLSPLLAPPVFLRWENKDELRVKYFDGVRALERDNPVSTTLGRWLRATKSPVGIDSVIDSVRSHVTFGEVKWAITAREIEQVYARGPSSCMSNSKGYYDIKELSYSESRFSVPSIYAYPLDRTEIVPDSGNNLAVAYFGDLCGRVTARALCDMKDMTFNRIYGDIPRMFRSLMNLGYKQNKDLLLNVPLSKVVSERNLVMCPYLDAKVTNTVAVGSDHIKLSLTGRFVFSTEKYLTHADGAYNGDNDDGDNDDDNE